METVDFVQEGILKDVVDRLVSSFAPRKILLFGSRAIGNAKQDSDYDLLIVWRNEDPPPSRAAAVRRTLLDFKVPFDIAVVTPSEYERYRRRRVHIVAIADREGRILHAA